jgi:LacI family transcriptional regulator
VGIVLEPVPEAVAAWEPAPALYEAAHEDAGRRMVTISEIARRADVSKTTVSRVLNGRPDVDARTAQRVRQLVTDLGYVPSATARALAHGRARCVGLLVPSLDLPWLLELLRGVADEVEAADYTLALHTVGNGAASLATFTAQVGARVIDGLVAVAPVDLDDYLANLVRRGLPVAVLTDHDHGLGAPTVWATDRDGGRLATAHLLALGRAPIATITGPVRLHGGCQRFSGYRDALAAGGLAFDPSLVREGDWTKEAGVAAMADLLRARPDLRGVFAANDLMALGAIKAIVASGRTVPGDIAVVGYDDIPVAAQTIPELTTVRQPLYEMGRDAARRVLAAIGVGAPPAGDGIHQTTLVVRESCGGRSAEVG